jgi:hypothetical protein
MIARKNSISGIDTTPIDPSGLRCLAGSEALREVWKQFATGGSHLSIGTSTSQNVATVVYLPDGTRTMVQCKPPTEHPCRERPVTFLDVGTHVSAEIVEALLSLLISYKSGDTSRSIRWVTQDDLLLGEIADVQRANMATEDLNDQVTRRGDEQFESPRFVWSEALYRARKAALEFGKETHAGH